MKPLLLHHATLIDGTGAAPLPDAAVLVENDRIRWAGAASDAPTDDATRVDLGGNTICPGFFDCHVHFSLPGAGATPIDRALNPPSYHYFQLIDRLRVTLHNGVTTARDLMGIDAGVRDAVAHGLVDGPRLLVAINMMSQTCGHADFHLPSGIDLTPMVGGSLVDTVDEARRRTRELIAAGADVIKVASSGGVSSPSDQPEWLGMRRELIAAVVEEAAAYGHKRVAAHAIGRAGIEAAVEAGVSSVEHGYQLDEGLRHKMVEAGIFLVPTLLETMADVTSSPAGQAKSAHWHAVAQESIGASAAAGVKIAVGTDAGLSPAHGTNLKELGLLVRFGGLTPMQAIVAATSTSAELCGLAEQLGTVEAGKLADLVIVRGDPLADIDSVGEPDNILLVLKEGRAAIDRAGFLTA
ncbi:amidohydrolase family protein [Mycolicibacterium monacense]|uniref:Hydrolase n=2 Tax=Mycobacteriaceae TaxID=1762 RepID=A0AAD1IV42_MYCMB|nr:amidohydrolase family protein [Mycolicibacterium monacense]MDA4100691.1 amidohydrolase [Mycolicibacterium monacense DSM 44395]OBF50917.1 amidohydrolase [Mycolicibacterium monacense]ORB14859.1 amidohydrolase [Mycolicibacterium monacense DSM 44395]QHP85621.1 amidohydrolase family protein [Mycolicibacterium monacense DSM 44395]BBZ61474.1 hydrolase [Mycolicibacterium monacense]